MAIVLKGILADSKKHYLAVKRRIEARIGAIPKGSIKERVISGRKYYYLQRRDGDKVLHKYLGPKVSASLARRIKEGRSLKNELKKVDAALEIIRRAEREKSK